MRITNTMMTNNILHNINRNKQTLSIYEEQLATGKKIQKPSDDPIVAVRALKFRTNIKEVDQYKSNSEDGISWCEVSEQAVANITDIMKRIRDLCVQAASDTMNIQNRKNTVTEVEQLMNQFMMEINASYAGRHVFGGYKTNVPVIFKEVSTDNYELTEHFSSDDVETVQRVVNDVIVDAHRIRLGYDEVDAPIDLTDLTSLPAFAGGVVTMNSTDATVVGPPDVGPYAPVAGTINFLQDTGELVFNEADVANIPATFDFEYSKNLFKKGDMVPDHYFDGRNTSTVPVTTFTVDPEEILYQISYSQELAVNTMAYDVVTIDMARDIQELVKTTTAIAADSSLTSELEEDLLGDMFGHLLTGVNSHIDNLLDTRADIGVKINRLELTINRLSEDNLNFTELMSKNEDIDFAEVMVKMSSQDAVYNASLQASSQIIQPSLLDFIR